MKIQYYSNLRAIACILVLMTHLAMPAIDPKYGIFMVFISVLGSPSSELFITMSSSLLAPTKYEMFEFYKKRFKKLIPPFLFWSFITVLLNVLLGSITYSKMIYQMLLFPIAPVYGVYWFVYVISGLYLLIPILSPWLREATKKQFRFILLLSFITIFLPYLNYFMDKDIYKIDGNYQFVLSFFGGYIVYFLLGVYLRKFPITFNKRVYFYLFSIVLLILGSIPFGSAYFYNRNLLPIVEHNLSFSSVCYVILIFTFCQNVKFPTIVESLFNIIAKYSFGIYLTHIIIGRLLVWEVMKNYRLANPLIETPLLVLITLILCIGILKILSYLPKSKYITGL